METHKSKSSAAIWILGVAGLLLVYWAVNKLDSRLESKRFSDSSYSPQPAVVALTGDKFAVVDKDNIAIYRVDAKGKVSRLDDVYTYYKELQPYDNRLSSQ